MRRCWKAVVASTAIVLMGQPAAAERVLRMTLQLPITNVLGQNATAFKKIVERESGGEITVVIHPSAELFVDKEVPRAVSSGAVEMGIVPLTRFAPLVPAVELVSLPFLFDSNEAVAAATAPNHRIRAILDKAILATGARPLWWQPFGMAIMLGKDQAPVHPNQLRAKKTRVFGTTMKKFVAAMGGEPVPVSGSKQYEAYKRRDVDFGMTGVTAVRSRKLYEVMGNLVKTNHTALEFVVVINAALWNALSGRERSILEAAAVHVERDLRMSYRDTHRATLEWIAANTNMTVSDLDATQLAAWRRAARPIYDSYARDAGTMGKELLTEARKFQ